MDTPLVKMLTPVYNGEPYLAECIESVLAQSYENWDYDIVNNCSTDGTLAVAESYAKKDRRIHVRTNAAFVSAVENHNTAFRLVPAHSKYCKLVSADDWILPDCVSKMVHFAEGHPAVGIVGSYQRSGDTIKWQGIPPEVTVMSGREAGRLGLLQGIHVFGTPTSVLYRSDLVRMRPSFFPHPRSHADTSACYEALQHSDLGFLHEVLGVERVHSGQWSTAMDMLNSGTVSYLEVLLQYGPFYLSPDEFIARKKFVFDRYYRGLGGCLLKLRGVEFWKFHRERLRLIGRELEWSRVIMGALKEAACEARNPVTAAQKVLTVMEEKMSR